LASAIGAAAGVATIYGLVVLGNVIGRPIDEDLTLGLLLVPTFSLSIGVAQWLVLRRHLPSAFWWPTTCLVGWAGAWTAIFASWAPIATWLGPYREFGVLTAFLFLGLGTGLCQWVYLRWRVQSAGWWILGSVIAWALVGLAVHHGSIDGPYLFAALVGPSPAVVTGCLLIWLLSRPRSG
jgi:hypothetical protein